jgi:hypothetical protein
MDEKSAPPSAPIEKAKNGREIFTDKIADEIVAACGSGFTLEKAGALVGVNANTIKTWASRKPEFARRVETARKKHELSLLRDIELAGQKSWQAKAWMAERIYLYSVPSARVQVNGSVEHGLSAGLAQILAGSLSKKEKPAQVIETKEVEKDISSPHSKYIVYCATNKDEPKVEAAQTLETATPSAPKRRRHVPMRRRPARKVGGGDTTTPLPTPPSP